MAESGWAYTHAAQWRAGLAALAAAGWQAELTCLAAPVQVEGRLPTGEPFYFRARHGEACLGAGGPDPADIPEWERCRAHPDAGHLPAGDGLAVIRELAASYAAERGGHP